MEIIKNKPSTIRNLIAKQNNPTNAIRNRRITVAPNVLQEINDISENRQFNRFDDKSVRSQNNVRNMYNKEWGGFDNQIENAFDRNVRFEDTIYE